MGMVKQDDGWRLPDALWNRMAPLLPPGKPYVKGGHNPGVPDRSAMNAIFFVLRTGVQWNWLNNGWCDDQGPPGRAKKLVPILRTSPAASSPGAQLVYWNRFLIGQVIQRLAQRFTQLQQETGSGAQQQAGLQEHRQRFPGGGEAGCQAHRHILAEVDQGRPVALAIMPPPRQTSPSYNTADWPGVTAHWAWSKARPNSSSPLGNSWQATSAWR